MKKRILFVLVAVLCAVSQTSCIIGWEPFEYNIIAEDCETFHVYSIFPKQLGALSCDFYHCKVRIYDQNFNQIDYFVDGDSCDVTIDCVGYMEDYQLDQLYIKLEPWERCGVMWGGYLPPLDLGIHWWRINATE